jgi:DNA helicase-2/ATP-dependent DNA helicase PcrA
MARKYTIRRETSGAPLYKIDYRGELNEAQLEAATVVDGPVLVVAGAGTGKTRTLVYRVARLVESGVPGKSILILTFTRRAAQEMLRRAEALLGNVGLESVTGGTFHSFANLVLRRYAPLYGWPERFSILDRGDSEDTIQLMRARLKLDPRERRFPRKRTLSTLFSSSINRDIPLEELLEVEYPHLFDDLKDIQRCRQAYEDYKVERSLLDYDDLLVHLCRRLEENDELRERLRNLYRYVMVDEYQDTNHLQARIVSLLAGRDGNLMVVGDDAQSIYGFRGADVENILRFPEQHTRTRTIRLEENYRSTQPILDATNAIIEVSAQRHEKTLFTKRLEGESPLLVPAPDEHWQSLFIRQRILELCEEGVPLDRIAVLFRSSTHSFDLELELTRAGIEYVKRGGFRFLETSHVKDVLAYLRVLENPRDSVAWGRLLLLLEGVGAKAAGHALDWLGASGRAPQELAQYEGESGLRRSAIGAIQRLGAFFATVDAARSRPAHLVDQILEHYQPTLERVYRDDAPKRSRDLEQFAVLAERFESLQEMLSDLALDPPADAVGGAVALGREDEGKLVLSTIHSAKGLEWHSVFVISMLDGRLPSVYALDDGDIEEERRLLYVACTRAEENLYLCYPVEVQDRALGGFITAQPSRFLEDIPDELLPQLRLEAED